MKIGKRKLINGTSLYLDFRHNGKRVKENLKIVITENDPYKKQKWAEAERLAHLRSRQLIDETYFSKTRFLDYFKHYADNTSLKSVRKYTSTLKYLENNFENKNLTELTKADFQHLLEQFYSTYAVSTANTYM